MVMAVAFDDAKANEVRKVTPGKSGRVTTFFGSCDTPDLPLASLNQHDPGRVSPAHFHINDQFQVVVGGKGRIGRHDLIPYSVHFSRAYTPYGPLVADAGTGLTFFLMRPHYDPGSQGLPKELEQLKRAPDRQPWQITRPVTFPPLQSDAAVADTILREIPDIKDEQGLAAYALSMKPNVTTKAPDPSNGNGQYLVVIKGSLWHDNKELKAPAMVFVGPNEGSFQIRSGSRGVESLVLNFPRRQKRVAGAPKSVQATAGFKTWQCTLCAFVYDEGAGLPAEGIAPGTRWQDVPETWNCPDCSASKSDFHMVEV